MSNPFDYNLKPYYEHAGVTIYHADCRDVLPKLDPVDLVFTSPPYWNQRMYECGKQDWAEVVPKAIVSTPAHQKTQILVNLGLIHQEGEVFCYWDLLKNAMRDSGYRLYGWYIWHQGSGLPGGWHGRLAPSHEFIFHYNKSSIQINKWVKTKGIKKPPGSILRGKNDKKHTKFSLDKIGQEFKIPDSVINIERRCPGTGIGKDHPAIFPIGLPKYIIKTFPCDIVLDPFMGSGTTLLAAKDLGKRAIGIEINEKYCEIAAKRLSQDVLFGAG